MFWRSFGVLLRRPCCRSLCRKVHPPQVCCWPGSVGGKQTHQRARIYLHPSTCPTRLLFPASRNDCL